MGCLLYLSSSIRLEETSGSFYKYYYSSNNHSLLSTYSILQLLLSNILQLPLLLLLLLLLQVCQDPRKLPFFFEYLFAQLEDSRHEQVSSS